MVRPVINITSAKLILGSRRRAHDHRPVGARGGGRGRRHRHPRRPGQPAGRRPADRERLDRLHRHRRRDPASTSPTEPGVRARRGCRLGRPPGRPLLPRRPGRAAPAAASPAPTATCCRADAGARDNMLTALGLRAGAYATEVSETYLGLFPTGGDLSLETVRLDGRRREGAVRHAGVEPAPRRPGRRHRDLRRRRPAAGPGLPARPRPVLLGRLRQPPAPDTPRTAAVDGGVNVERGPSTFADAALARRTARRPCSASSAPSSTPRRASAPRVQRGRRPAGRRRGRRRSRRHHLGARRRRAGGRSSTPATGPTRRPERRS